MNQVATEIEIEIEPYGTNIPKIIFGIDNCQISVIEVNKKNILKFDDVLSKGRHFLFIEFFGKEEHDPDTAVLINRVTVESMTFDRFKWSSKYYPRYPKSYIESQNNPLPDYISNSTHLGWNGVWRFEFETPIFQWIHRIEHLGWLYD